MVSRTITGTASTTAPDVRQSGMDVVKILMTGLAVALLALALPRAIANVLTDQASAQEGVDVIAPLSSAARFTPLDPNLYSDAFSAYWNAGQRDKAFQALDSLLEVEPASSLNWILRATSIRHVTLVMQDVEASLDMSLRTGRFEPRGQVARLKFGFSLWRNLSEPLQMELREQVAAIWSVRRLQRDLAALYLKAGETTRAIILESLPQSKSQQERFLRLVEQQAA